VVPVLPRARLCLWVQEPGGRHAAWSAPVMSRVATFSRELVEGREKLVAGDDAALVRRGPLSGPLTSRPQFFAHGVAEIAAWFAENLGRRLLALSLSALGSSHPPPHQPVRGRWPVTGARPDCELKYYCSNWAASTSTPSAMALILRVMSGGWDVSGI
jgi:hypothetical protein